MITHAYYRLNQTMLLVIDNYDSFTYNLVDYFTTLDQDCLVKVHDAVSCDDITALQPERIVLSPGPGNPDQAGICLEAIATFAGKIPILGICLGHQCIGQHFGGRIIPAPQLMHGKTSAIQHHGRGIFQGLAQPLTVTRYHSLAIDPDSLPNELAVTAWSDDGCIMAVQHTKYSVIGVQFHPEAVLTQQGHQLLQNWLTYK